MIDAARSLGLTAWQTWWRVNIPLARPAIAAGALLALMETMADYGASVYFGLQTFTTAIYRAWFSMGDRMAASQLAGVLLVLVLGILALERLERGRARFFTPTASQRPAPRSMLHGWRAWGAAAACIAPVVLGFVLPVLLLVRLLVPAWTSVDWPRILGIGSRTRSASPSLDLRSCSSRCSGSRMRRAPRNAELPATLVHVSVRLMSLGYALPGAVVAVGILVPLATFDNGLDGFLKSRRRHRDAGCC